MAQQPRNRGHVDVTTTPQDLRGSLSAGGYEAQPIGGSILWYVGGATAPTDTDDYRELPAGIPLPFTAGGTSPALWVRTASGTVPVALRDSIHIVADLPAHHPHVTLSTTAVDLRDGRDEGNYRATVVLPGRTDSMLLYIGNTAPADLDEWWRVGNGSMFTFCAGPGTVRTWVRTVTGTGRILVEAQ